MNRVGQFQGKYRFLSNFWPATVVYEERIFPSVEHAYVWAKFFHLDFPNVKEIQYYINGLKAGQVKTYGRQATEPPGMKRKWAGMSEAVMAKLVESKFSELNPVLVDQLLATGDAELVEGNTWGDKFWGVDLSTGKGDNRLGKLLMQRRAELRGRKSGTLDVTLQYGGRGKPLPFDAE
jgi:ribA/ribD-fused uncharacterized protein